MAAALQLPTQATLSPAEDMTDEQIEQELLAATARLQAKSKDTQLQVAKQNESKGITIPKLNTGDLPRPYVSMDGHIATVDASRLVDERYRKLQVRTVEDPVVAKKAAEEVCIYTLAYNTLGYEENNPKFFS